MHKHTVAQKPTLPCQQDFLMQRNRFVWMTMYIKGKKDLDRFRDLFLPFTYLLGQRLFNRMLSAAFLGAAPKNMCWYYCVASWKDPGALKS